MPESGREQGSYRQILRSSSIVGGASVAQIALGLLRMKAAALIVGPAGVGLIGLFNNLVVSAAALGGCGVGSAATRQLAAERSRSGDEGEAVVRRALASAAAILALAATALFWLLRKPLALLALGDARFASAVGWLSIGVGLTIVAAAQTSLLAGLRRMTPMAWTYVIAGALATLAGIAALWLLGPSGLVLFVIAVPLASVVAGGWFVAKLPRAKAAQSGFRAMWPQWRQLLGLGAAIMIGQLLGSCAQLAARSLIAQRMGLSELGLFQAAWAISMTYLGVVLQAMAADYYPRLSEAIHDREKAVRIANEQTEVALLLGGPIVIAGIGLAPVALDILYSAAFRPAADLLRWQMLADVLKIASWPAGYVLLSAGRGRTFVALEALGWAIFLAATWLLLPYAGLVAPGIGYLAMYLVYLPAVFLAAHQAIGFRWSPLARSASAMIGLCALLAFGGARFSPLAGGAVGVLMALAIAIFSIRELRGRLRGSAGGASEVSA